MKHAIRIAALISGSGTNLQAVIDACAAGRIDGDVVCVGTDNPNASGLERARRHGIPTFVVDYAAVIRRFREDPRSTAVPPDFDPPEIAARQNLLPPGTDAARVKFFLTTRAVAEADLLSALTAHRFDLLILAGFMRTLSPYFIDRVNSDPMRPRIMNIHPALLPAFPGTDGYADTFAYGCKVGGCTVHFVDYGEDSGPIIGQRAFAIQPEDTLEAVRKRGLAIEWALYPACIQLFAQKRLELERRCSQSGRDRWVVTIKPAAEDLKGA